jgi:hypothetical protein
MIVLAIPAILAVVLGLCILAEMYSFTTRPMARSLSKSELRRRYKKTLPATRKLRQLTEELKSM